MSVTSTNMWTDDTEATGQNLNNDFVNMFTNVEWETH